MGRHAAVPSGHEQGEREMDAPGSAGIWERGGRRGGIQKQFSGPISSSPAVACCSSVWEIRQALEGAVVQAQPF